MIVIGFDPSLTHFGYAVLDGDRFIEAGAIVTAPSDDDGTRTDGLTRRCREIFSRCMELAHRRERPRLVTVEALALPWGKTSMQTVSTLGRVRGLVDALAAIDRAPVIEYQPAHLKKLVVPTLKKPTKEDVKAVLVDAHPELRELLAVLPRDEQEHAADAVASIHAAVFVEQR